MDNLLTDEIMKRRLLIDGDGVGDDRKLISLMKSYIGWGTSTGPALVTLRPLLSQLHQIDQSQHRSHEAIKVNQEARKMFVGLKAQVQYEIKGTKDQILESKNLLEEATKHRKYSMEYDALAKLIQSKPDRKGTERRRVELQRELHTLRSRQGNLDMKLEERKKNLSMMSSTIERLKELLGEEDKIMDIVSHSSVPLDSPMEVDNPRSVPSSPTLQIAEEVSQSLDSVSGEVISVPLSPLPKAKFEKYEDLSESDGEQG